MSKDINIQEAEGLKMSELLKEQAKEIEKLKEENEIQQKQLNNAFDRGFISTYKIKEKIEEYKQQYKTKFKRIDVLQNTIGMSIEELEELRKLQGEVLELQDKIEALESLLKEGE